MTRQATLHALALFSALFPATHTTDPGGGLLRTWAHRAFDRDLHLRTPARGHAPARPSRAAFRG